MRYRYFYRKTAKLFANSGDPDQMPHSVASDLGMHCLPITGILLGVSRLQWVNDFNEKKNNNNKKASIDKNGHDPIQDGRIRLRNSRVKGFTKKDCNEDPKPENVSRINIEINYLPGYPLIA